MAKTQKYNIKFPINILSDDRTLFDLNKSKADKIKSELMFLIFTQKGQRLRMPDFGTNLIQFIFNPNDTQTWEDVKYEIKESVSKYVTDCSLEDIEIYEEDEGKTLLVALKFLVTEDDGSVTLNTLITAV